MFDKLLRGITRKSFDDVIRDIDTKLSNHLQELEKIGPARNDSTSQRMFLIQLAADYQALVNTATHSSYGHGNCFQDKEMRLTSLIMNTSERFSDTMARESFTRLFRVDLASNGTKPDNLETLSNREIEDCEMANDIGDDSDPDNADDDDDVTDHGDDEDDEDDDDWESLSAKGATDDDASDLHKPDFYKIMSRYPELHFLTIRSSELQYSQEKISVWIRREFQSYRSLGIGGLNPALYQALFKEQTAPWVVLAKVYVNRTILGVHNVLHKLLGHVCADSTAREAIWTRMVPGLVARYTQATQHLELLLRVERDGNLGTLNHYLAENIQKSNEARTLHRLKYLSSWEMTKDEEPQRIPRAWKKAKGTESQTLLRLSDVTKFYQSNEDHEVEAIHDTLKSYCKVARKRFVDNVYMQVIDHLLLTSDTSSPFKIFTPAWVGSLSDADLADIAGETESITYRRKVLQEEIESFQQGLKILRG